ncbi:programmed cell death protein 10-B-like [Paramacrobiotus metropolitanus]|uniref:programmed cell death protein 10-B-like n=1 Tax=Paramacrobiotus metropolitanus TaxID=2943436 RepID=UPI002445F19B|nr:programmed cell death protein 10-B-like [Paramacrobiotus metropolitanus]
MGDDSPVISSAYPIIIKPAFDKVNQSVKEPKASDDVRDAFSKVESAYPGWTHDFLSQLIRAVELPVVSLNEPVLRLEASVENEGLRINRSDDIFQDLNKKSANLKRILSRIPDEITDRRTFLETIKEIASAIKKLLDCVHQVTEIIPSDSGRQTLEQRKKEFVKFSKRFSNTLKDFFKDGQANAVFYSANCLINQTNLIVQTVKEKCE